MPVNVSKHPEPCTGLRPKLVPRSAWLELGTRPTALTSAIRNRFDRANLLSLSLLTRKSSAIMLPHLPLPEFADFENDVSQMTHNGMQTSRAQFYPGEEPSAARIRPEPASVNRGSLVQPELSSENLASPNTSASTCGNSTTVLASMFIRITPVSFETELNDANHDNTTSFISLQSLLRQNQTMPTNDNTTSLIINM